MPKDLTSDSFGAMLTFKHDSKFQCNCNDSKILFVKSDLNNKLSHGLIGVNDKKEGISLADKKCGDDNGDSIACQTNTPVCLKPLNAGDDDDMTAAAKCNGRYEYYDCNLTEMFNQFAKLADRLLHLNPMSILKWIIYIVVGIIILYLLITMIMSVIRSRMEGD